MPLQPAQYDETAWMTGQGASWTNWENFLDDFNFNETEAGMAFNISRRSGFEIVASNMAYVTYLFEHYPYRSPIMPFKTFMRDTTFGHIANAVTGGKAFPWEEMTDQAVQRHYLDAKSEDVPAEKVKTKEYVLIDWTENDPQNRIESLAESQSVYIGSAIYTAGLTDVTEKFHVSEVAALLGLTLFVAGYGLGPMIFAPLSEMPFFGRTSIYVGTLVVFVGLQPAVIYAKNFGMLLAFRFLTGFFGSRELQIQPSAKIAADH
ncbi:hypothetical protein MRB53_040100 [Persea americana]|nr:hypothetical protein MRB53_040100 [Persea americana]